MKTTLHASAYKKLAEEYKIDLALSDEQVFEVEENRSITLSEDQLDFIVNQLTAAEGVDSFLQNNVKNLSSVTLSLFVLNDRLWKMMERKPWDTDKMLAMSTIPLCTWDQKEEKTSNPKGVKRWQLQPNTISFTLGQNPTIIIDGEGGDFSGFIEQSHLTMRKFGIPDTRKLIPNYIFEKLKLSIILKHAVIDIHPKPRQDLDYDYSEHARVFYEHGFAISLPGENVTLSVGKRKPTKMFGDVYLLIGNQIVSEKDHYNALKTDIWLHALQQKREACK